MIPGTGISLTDGMILGTIPGTASTVDSIPTAGTAGAAGGGDGVTIQVGISHGVMADYVVPIVLTEVLSSMADIVVEDEAIREVTPLVEEPVVAERMPAR